MADTFPKSSRKRTLDPRPRGVKAPEAPPEWVKALAEVWTPPAGPLLVAVSGGGDSVALLRFLHLLAPARGWRLFVGHVDHGLRDDSADDGAWVQELADQLGLPCLLRRVEVPAKGRSLEEAARAARRKALAEMASSLGAEAIALAHNSQDQAETLLMRLFTGSGLTGLAAMLPWDPPWWRPLLGVRPQDLRAWLQTLGQEWRSDPTNDDRRYLRNRVRHDLLPLAEGLLNPKSVEALGRLASGVAAEEEHWRGWCERAFARRGWREGESWCLEAQWLSAQSLGERRRLVRFLAGRASGKGQHLLAGHVDQLLALLAGPSGKELTLPCGLKAWREQEALRLGHALKPLRSELLLGGPGHLWLPGLRLTLEARVEASAPQLQARGPRVWLPLLQVRWPLAVRPPRPGEHFHPLGAPGSKRISRILMDLKTPAWWRARALVVVDSQGPWWLLPFSVAQRARQEPQKGPWLGLSLIDTEHPPLYTRFFKQ